MTLCHCEIATVVLVGHVVVRRRDAAAVLIGLGLGHLAVPRVSPPAAVRTAGVSLRSCPHPPGRDPEWLHRQSAGTSGVLARLTYDYTRVATLCALPVIVQVALGLATRPDGLPRFLRRLPFPLVFLLQFQIQDAQRICDSRWFATGMLAVAADRGSPAARPGS
jgi:hypothetical protein